MAPRLEVKAAAGESRSVEILVSPFTMGRAPGNQLTIADDTSLSRNHLSIEMSGGEQEPQWLIRDLSSKNGTWVNGEPLNDPRPLKPGDTISAGQTTLVFSVPEVQTVPNFIEETAPPAREDLTFAVKLDALLEEPAAGQPFFDRSADAGRHFRALVEAGRELAGHRPLEELFPLILDLSAKAVGASRGILIIKSGEHLESRAVIGEGVKVSRRVIEKVLTERTSMLVADARAHSALAGSMTIMSQSVRSLMAAPLQTRDSVLGLVYLDSPGFISDFTPEDLNLLTVMANIAAVRVEHARLAEVEQTEKIMARELEQAADLQRSLIPTVPPDLKGFDLAARTLPCHSVGGDFYDYGWAADGRFALIVADASGKGMPASLMVSSLQARFLTLLDGDYPLHSLATRLNRGLCEKCPGNRFVTVFMALLDLKTGELEYVNAGHNPPLLAGPSGAIEQLSIGGPIMGMLPGAKFGSGRIVLEPGATLVVYTDGVTEAVNGAMEEFGMDRLNGIVSTRRESPAAESVEEICRAVEEFSGEEQQADDITALVLRRPA